jgi:N-acetylglucosaminyl-diphospho-decaprenol L-rhamnosyltransferase
MKFEENRMPVRSPRAQPRWNARGIGSRIYIVLPVYNRRLLVERFLNRLNEQTFRNFTVIVVDDGSTDGTATLIEKRFSNVHLLRGDGSLWWTGATNVGIRHAMKHSTKDDAILIINDDLEISPDYLESLYRVWNSMPNTLIGSVVVDINDPERIIDGGRLVNWWTAKFRHLNIGKKLNEFNKNYHVDVSLLTGWGTLVPVQVFYDVGLYDDTHFQQCGDTELTARAKNRGYRLIMSYAAIVKCAPEQTASINVARFYSLRDLKTYFFDVKSNYRLKYRYFFAKNAARNPAAFVSFLICDLARVTVHFLRRLRFKPRVEA